MDGDRPALTAEQRRIVEQQQGPVLVIAGVGSGKTRVLAHRAAAALQRGTPAASILALTFTNRAAQEMRARVEALVGDAGQELTIGTFHALCARILRRDGKWLAIEPNFAIWDDVDSAEAVRLAGRAVGQSLVEKTLKGTLDRLRALKMQGIYPQNWRGPDTDLLPLYREYQHLLETSNALDYDDLVAQTWTLLKAIPGVCEEWGERYGWVQVDEFQDTADREYDVLHLLTQGHRCVAVFADPNQWIYRWRRVDGPRIIGRFQADFPERQELSLSENFRSTRVILAAAQGVISKGAAPLTLPPEEEPDPADRVRVRAFIDETAEGSAIAVRLVQLHAAGRQWHEIGVLTRTNARAVRLAAQLDAATIPHLTVTATEFFRYAEIKDILAYLRLIADPLDLIALRRIVNKPARGIGDAILERIEQTGREWGLFLTDLVDEACLEDGDPCAAALRIADEPYVAFDLEATGRDPLEDAIVEVAAVAIEHGAEVGRRRALLRPWRPVGASESIHHYSDALLATKGRDPAEVLARFVEFVGDRPLVGHNVDRYDVPLLNANLRRAGLAPLLNRTADTLPLSRRILPLDRHDLARVRAALGVAETPTHQAMDDAACAAACFPLLAERLAATSEARRRIVAGASERFWPLARLVGGWRRMAPTTAPSELLAVVLRESGYEELLRKQQAEGAARLRRLRELRDLVAMRFDSLPSAEALTRVLEYAGLAKSVDQFSRDQDRVPVLTMHSAKGLEFDAVLIAGAYDGEIPSYLTLEDPEQLEEERRLLYVGMTRARRSLEISYPTQRLTPYGKVIRLAPSRFLADAPPVTLDRERGI